MQSLEKTVSMTKQTLNEILKPIGLCVQNTDYSWRIETCYDAEPVICLTNDMRKYFAETFRTGTDGLNKILETIRRTRRWMFAVYSPRPGYKSIDNPYFDCHSLEEMLIKKDLLDDRRICC